jgi:ketosteroid isomerase-like protein
MRTTKRLRLIVATACAAGVIGVPGLAGSWEAPAASAQAIGQTQEKASGGCCAKHKAGATDEQATHEHAGVSPDDAVIDVVKAWLDAIPKRDTGKIAPLLADDFVAILPDGRRRVKAEHLKEVADGKYEVQALTLEEPRVRIFGSVAIVTYYQGEESRTHGEDTSGASAWTDILVNQHGAWQIVAEHGSRFK